MNLKKSEGPTKVRAKVVAVRRANNSVNGNPNWGLTIQAPPAGHMVVVNAPDSMVGHEIVPSLAGKTVELTMEGRFFTDLRVIDEEVGL
jgi:hypothetical protein